MIMMVMTDPDIYNMKTGLLSRLVRPVLLHAFLESFRSKHTSRMLAFHGGAFPPDRHGVALSPTGGPPWKPGEGIVGARNDARAAKK